MARTDRSEGEWIRVLGLFLVAMGLSVVQPGALVAAPFLALVLVLPAKGFKVLLAAGLAALFLLGQGPESPFWYLERGWAVLLGGWFLALTLRWPRSPFLPRALGAVAGATGVAALFFALDPRRWAVADWLVSDHLRSGVVTALEGFHLLGGGEGLPAALISTAYETVALQGRVFPALLGLASMAALGVGWWLYVRLAQGRKGALGPLREFRFHDQLVWVFVLGLALVLTGGSRAWERMGTNALVFMSGLYALRGMAVVLFVYGGLSVVGGILLALGILFFAPVILAGALLIGLGDTWLDLRTRARRMAE